MPAGIREDVGHDLGGSRIESGKKDPGLEGEDGGDHRQQNDAAAGADNLQAQHEQPGEDEDWFFYAENSKLCMNTNENAYKLFMLFE